jgi:CDP-6-deoxy-D-xylo-4-hexulose-3-dehydrase
MEAKTRLDWPLMADNITKEDRLALVNYLGSGCEDVPRLTNGPQVQAFEEEFAQWLGTKYAVMVSSGASANLLTMQALKIISGVGEVLVPVITWVSDIAAILHAGMEPKFVDVHPQTLGVDWDDLATKVTERTKAAFVTHCLGFNACPNGFPQLLPMIEDCCEALGAYADGRKLGCFGYMSNFSFYYAHHLSTVEGGMICTHDEKVYQLLRMLRSHGLAREMTSDIFKAEAAKACPDLDPKFIFTHPAYNVRPIELQAVIGRSQLKRLDVNNGARTVNLRAWLDHLDTDKYRTDYTLYGSSNYALPLVLKEPDDVRMALVLSCLKALGVEYRKGTAGGGNQLRQPYARERWGELYTQFPQAEHIHHYGLYLGNYPTLEAWKIDALTEKLNAL